MSKRRSRIAAVFAAIMGLILGSNPYSRASPAPAPDTGDMSSQHENAKLTIRVVARHAGVSATTVSRVYSGSRQVSEANRKRVLAAAAELGYSPDIIAQNLATGRSGVIGVVVPDLSNPHFTTLVKRLIHASAEDSYKVLVADADEVEEAEYALATDLLRRCDAIVVCNPRSNEQSLLQLAEQPKPVLFVNRDFASHKVSTAITDVGPAMQEITRHVIGLGHRRIAYVGGRIHSYLDDQRWQAIRQAGTADDVHLVKIPIDTHIPSWPSIAKEVLERECTAVLANNDQGAISLAATLTRMGVDVPSDVSIAGFDDIPLASWFTPPLTTARIMTDELGEATWKAIRQLLEDPSTITHSTLVATAVFRESTTTRR